MKVVGFQKFVQVNVGSSQDSNLRILDVCFGEVNNEKAVIDLGDVESISVGVVREEHVSISKISFILSPS